jgi:hypothetical protein
MAADPELRRLFTLHLINAWDFAVGAPVHVDSP